MVALIAVTRYGGLEAAAPIFAIAAPVGVLAVAFIAFSMLPWENIKKGSIALLACTVSLGLLLLAAGNLSKIGGKAGVLGILACAALMAAFAFLYTKMSNIETEKLEVITLGLFADILALSALLAACALVGKVGAAALHGLGIIGIVMAAFLAVSAIIGTIGGSKVADLINSGMEALIALSDGIGRVVTAWIGGMIDQLASYLPMIANSCKKFCDIVGSINIENAASRIGLLVELAGLLTMVAANGVVENIFNFLATFGQGEDVFDQFKERVKKLG